MIILGIDSSTDSLGIGLAKGNTIIADELLESQREHASRVIAMIDAVLSKAEIELSDVKGIAVAIGPGSFTGLRVGLAAAKGLSLALKIPLIGISTFEVIARRLRREYDGAYLCSTVRKGEMYLFRLTNKATVPDDIAIVKEESIPEIISQSAIGIIGKQPIDWDNRFSRVIDRKKTSISGGDLARMGTERLLAGEIDDAMTLEPLYIAPSQAEERFGRK